MQRLVIFLILLIFTDAFGAAQCRSLLAPTRAEVESLDGVYKGMGLFLQSSTIAEKRESLVEQFHENKGGWSELQASYLEAIKAAASTPFLKALVGLVEASPTNHRLADFINRGQMKSKHWLVDSIEAAQDRIFQHLGRESLGTVLVVGGWFGSLPELIMQRTAIPFDKFISNDLDPQATKIALTLHERSVLEGRFDAFTDDAMTLDYAALSYSRTGVDGKEVAVTERPDIIINTSSEHFPDFPSWYARIPSGKILILQSNNYFAEPQHCNCVPSLAAFQEQAPLSQVFLRAEVPVYTDLSETKIKYIRYLLIGVK